MKTLAALVAVILAFPTAVAYALVWSGQKPCAGSGGDPPG